MPVNVNPERKRFYFSLFYSTLFVLLLIVIHIVCDIFNLHLYEYGIYPRSTKGLIGIFTAPLIHENYIHLFSNAFPLLTLGVIVCYFYRAIAFRLFFSIYIMTGVCVWIGARESYHIGASGLIYSFVAFVFISGLIRKNQMLLLLSAMMMVLYIDLIPGIFPRFDGISWESHLLGAVAGVVAAIYFRKEGPQATKYDLENDDEEDEENNGNENETNNPAEKNDSPTTPSSPFDITYTYIPRKPEKDPE